MPKQTLQIIKLIILLVILTGCRSKKVMVEQYETGKQTENFKRLDSLFTLNTAILREFQSKSFFESTHFELRTKKDSNGIEKPLEYIHEINGKVVEKVSLSGGSLLRSKDTNNIAINQTESEKKDEKSKVFLMGKNTDNHSVKVNAKAKDIKSEGGIFGTYISIIIIVVIFAVLVFLMWRLSCFKH